MPHSLLSDYRSQATFLGFCAVLIALGGFVFGQRGGEDGEVRSLAFAVDETPDEELDAPPQFVGGGVTDRLAERIEFSVDSIPPVATRQTIEISGTAAVSTRVFSETTEATYAADGRWVVPVVLVLGENEVLIEGMGENGDIASETLRVQFDPGELPEVAFTAEQQFRFSQDAEPWEFFSGTATPLSTVVVRSDYGTASTVASETGAWSTAVFFDASGTEKSFVVVVEAANGSADFDFVYTPAPESESITD